MRNFDYERKLTHFLLVFGVSTVYLHIYIQLGKSKP